MYRHGGGALLLFKLATFIRLIALPSARLQPSLGGALPLFELRTFALQMAPACEALPVPKGPEFGPQIWQVA